MEVDLRNVGYPNPRIKNEGTEVIAKNARLVAATISGTNSLIFPDIFCEMVLIST